MIEPPFVEPRFIEPPLIERRLIEPPFVERPLIEPPIRRIINWSTPHWSIFYNIDPALIERR
jgi:hypothetical protein